MRQFSKIELALKGLLVPSNINSKELYLTIVRL